jgi:parallel beta-helix repeat protein
MAKNLFGLVHTLLDDSGALEPGGTIEVYDAGTTTPRTVYSDRALTTTAGYQITSDAAGRLPERWISDGIIVKLVYKDSSGVTLATRDYANDNADDSENYNVLLYGATGNGSTDDTAAFTAAGTAAAAAGRAIYIPGGTYIVNNWTPPTNTLVYGDGMHDSILKRPNSAASNASVVNLTATGVTLRDLCVDGNKANQTLGSNNVSITSGYNYQLERVWFKNAKAASGYGSGLAISSTSDQTNDTVTQVLGCVSSENDGAGVSIDECWNVTIDGNRATNNGGAGITLVNLDAPIEPASQRYISIINNVCLDNSASGIAVLGTTTDNIMPVYSSLQAFNIIVSGNRCRGNAAYGIGLQGQLMECINNQCYENGGTTSGFYGGILFNAYSSICSNNICNSNAFYGIDAGGSVDSIVCDNICSTNGNATANGGVGINIGGSTDTSCDDNVLINNGALGAGAGIGIQCAAYELSGSGAGFPYRTSNVSICNNMIVLTVSTQGGVYVKQGGDGLVVQNNSVRGGSANLAFLFETDSIRADNNVRVNDATIGGHAIASAATLVIPDYCDVVSITGSTDITGGIRSYSQNLYHEKVAWLEITNGGSGYTSAPTVSFSGGGGSGAAATAYVGTGGAVTSILMTNHGSGYTSTPTVSFSGGGGSGAAATAQVGVPNRIGRKVTLVFTGTAGLYDTTQLYLNGGKHFFPSSTSEDTITLLAMFGTNWHEMGRSSNTSEIYANTRTATQIADKTNDINTKGKYAGRIVYDTTNNRLMVASGTTDVSNWHVADGSASVTPA